MQNARLDEAQAEIRIARRNINNLRYADNTTLMAESKEKPKNLLMRMKEESEKAGLKLKIHKTATVQPPQDPGEPSGETALVNDLERNKEKML